MRKKNLYKVFKAVRWLKLRKTQGSWALLFFYISASHLAAKYAGLIYSINVDSTSQLYLKFMAILRFSCLSNHAKLPLSMMWKVLKSSSHQINDKNRFHNQGPKKGLTVSFDEIALCCCSCGTAEAISLSSWSSLWIIFPEDEGPPMIRRLQ